MMIQLRPPCVSPLSGGTLWITEIKSLAWQSASLQVYNTRHAAFCSNAEARQEKPIESASQRVGLAVFGACDDISNNGRTENAPRCTNRTASDAAASRSPDWNQCLPKGTDTFSLLMAIHFLCQCVVEALQLIAVIKSIHEVRTQPRDCGFLMKHPGQKLESNSAISMFNISWMPPALLPGRVQPERAFGRPGVFHIRWGILKVDGGMLKLTLAGW